SSILVTHPSDAVHLPSFPTRRSSDLARATAGLAGVGLGVAGHAATKGRGALGRGRGVMGSLVGGVGGATLLGGMYVGGKIIDARAREKDAISDTEDYSSASAYRTALGQASMATQSFAD